MATPIVRVDRVTLRERDVRFTLYRVPRRRQVHVMVNEDGSLEVRAPWRFSVEEARVAIHEHGQWVLEALDACRTRVRMRPPLVSGTELPLLDDRLRLRVEMNAQLELFDGQRGLVARSGSVVRQGQTLAVRVQSLQRSAVRGLLEEWYRCAACVELPRRLAELACEVGVQYSRVTVRSQRTRWGSCSSTGAISLNWRLLQLPSRLCDYVLVHELCHLREMNHSPSFWAEVARVVPDYRDCRARVSVAARTFPL
jgi:predicted metal-dependent hydrolase